TYKGWIALRQQRQLDWDFIGLPDNTDINVDTARGIAKRIREEVPAKMQDYILPSVLLSASDRFSTTQSIQDASMVVHELCESESERSESELSIIRYIAWAIPSI
ncbi:MAG: MotA/TolQ/ExbB proton channel family protein, partial [Deltaproteobacteria bacterium]|nr:MotA/TolQ/ExbB proton channel family protein [Deltaproteobacteria bacterium]